MRIRIRSCLKIPSGLRAAAKAPVGVGQTRPYRQIWADSPALTATFSLALGISPVILKQLLLPLLSGLALLVATPVYARDFGLNLGGGTLFDPTRPGGHFSLEMSLSDEYPTHLAPFFEFYSKSGTRIIPIGISLLYKPPLSEYGGTIYFGAGGGALLIRGQPTAGLATGTDGMITVAGGLSFGVGPSAGVFVQVRWFRSFEDQTAENEIGVQAGIRFYIPGD